MRFARTRFWTALAALAGVWLAMMLWGGPDDAWDREVFAGIHGGASQTAIEWARIATHLGGWIVLSIVGLAAVVTLAFKRRRRAALLLVMLFVGRMAVELHKLLAGAPRPPIADEVLNEASLAFPSGHAANSMITYVAIALLVPVGQRNRAVAVVLAVSLSIVIGLSRVVIGVHWPSDVIGGWAFGLLLVVIFMRLASARPEGEAGEASNAAERMPPLRHFPWRRRRQDDGPEQPE
jgi:undecaprenyl-diphosphatase